MHNLAGIQLNLKIIIYDHAILIDYFVPIGTIRKCKNKLIWAHHFSKFSWNLQTQMFLESKFVFEVIEKQQAIIQYNF